MSMSMSVDDTFAFVTEQRRLHGVGGVQKGWRAMQRAKSDASSFDSHPGAGAAAGGHGKSESDISVSSSSGMPPISLYNRSSHNHGHGHSRNDSLIISSSVALAYARHGTMLMTTCVWWVMEGGISRRCGGREWGWGDRGLGGRCLSLATTMTIGMG